MSNALTTQQSRNALASQPEVDPFADAGQEMGGGDASYMKFNGNSGEYTYGADSEELPHGTRLVANMQSFRRGWICWKDGNPVDEKMTLVVDGKPPAMSQLPDHGPYMKNGDQEDGWSEQSAVDLKDPETGKGYTLKISSKSGLRGMGTLLQEFAKTYKQHPGEVPVVELQTQSFQPKNKLWGKKHALKLPIVEWINEAELMAAFGEDASAYEGEEQDGGEDEVNDEVQAAAPEPAPAPAPVNKPRPATQPAATGAAPAGPRRRGF